MNKNNNVKENKKTTDKVAIIWDLDGTLLDSYSSLVICIYNAFLHFGVRLEFKDIYEYSIKYSLTDFARNVIKEHNLNGKEILDFYNKVTPDVLKNVGLMENAFKTLEKLDEMGVEHYVYTHKGDVTDYILEHTGIKKYFKEVVTAANGFNRKPDPEGMDYLINKYNLDRSKTIYVGDRMIDIVSAKNAKITSILFNDPRGFEHKGYGENYLVDDLYEIVDIVRKKYFNMLDFDNVINRFDTGSVKWDIIDNKFKDREVIPMWVADMDFMVAPEIVNTLKDRLTHPVFGYPTYKDEYKENFANHFNTYNNHSVNKDDIILSTGVVHSINAIVQALAKENDKIIIHSPTYPPFRKCVVNNNRILVDTKMVIKNGRYEIDFDDLESKIDDKCKMFILCNPQNPTGRVFDKEELNKLAQICEKHNLLIISDEIHSDFIYDKEKFVPFMYINNYTLNNTITCVSCTKSFNLAGLKVSAMFIKNKEIFDKVKFRMNTNGVDSINIFGLEASKACYTKSEYWLTDLVKYLKSNLDYTCDFIDKNLPHIKYIKPESTYLLWLDMSYYKKENIQEDLANNAKIFLNDGKTYSEDYTDFVRLNFACPRSILECALNNLKEYLKD